jgi:hypothetical protein
VLHVVGKLQVRRGHSRTGQRNVRTRTHSLQLGGKLGMIRCIQHAHSATHKKMVIGGEATMRDDVVR